VENVARQASHLLSAITVANAIAMVPDGEDLEVGEMVSAMIIDASQLNGA
jgi:molybdopterin biosynthesis enzyme